MTVRFKPALVPFSLGGHWRSKAFLHKIKLIPFYDEEILNEKSLIMGFHWAKMAHEKKPPHQRHKSE